MKEKTLNDKRKYLGTGNSNEDIIYKEKDVKEFIKLLKKEITYEIMDTHSLSLVTNAVIVGGVNNKIDKLAGDDLI